MLDEARPARGWRRVWRLGKALRDAVDPDHEVLGQRRSPRDALGDLGHELSAFDSTWVSNFTPVGFGGGGFAGGFGLGVAVGGFGFTCGLGLCGASVAVGLPAADGVVAFDALVATAIADGDGTLLVAQAVRTSAKTAPRNARPNVMPGPPTGIVGRSAPVGPGYALETPSYGVM